MVASVVTGAVLKLVSVRPPTLQLRVRSLSENFHLVKPAELKPCDVAEESRRHYLHHVQGYSLLSHIPLLNLNSMSYACLGTRFYDLALQLRIGGRHSFLRLCQSLFFQLILNLLKIGYYLFLIHI